MGSGGGATQPATLPPPPVPVIKYDPATSAAENALASAAKQSYASTVETEDDKTKTASLGSAAPAQTAKPAPGSRVDALRPARRRDPASALPLGSMGTSAVLTG